MNFDERVRRKNEFDGNLVYGTKQFNLLTGRHRHLGYRQKHDNQWINAKKGLIHNKFAEKRRCPLCGADYFDTLFLKEGFPHQKCRVCELVYVSPILNREVYMRWSRNERTYVSVLKTKVQTKMQTLKSIYILDILRLYLNKRSVVDVCDIGCGPGVLLSEAKKRKYNAFGIEPNKKCHKLLEKKGIDYTRDFFPLKEYGRKKFDCVFLLNVLEHMRNPVEMAKATKKNIENPRTYLHFSAQY